MKRSEQREQHPGALARAAVSAPPLFDSHADDYHSALDRGLSVSGEGAEFFARGRVEWLARRLKAHGVATPAVLDFGCGTGTATRFLIELLKPSSVIGLDESIKSLEVARQRHSGLGVSFERAADYTPRGSIDLVHCNGVFHHVATGDRASVARYIAACLRPDGWFALWENNPWSPAARYVMSRIPFDRGAIMVWPSEAQGLSRGAGLLPGRPDYLFIFPRSLSFLRWVERFLARLPLGAQYLVLARKGGGM